MKSMFFYFFALFNCTLFAQTLDPYKFFPSSVGNVWEYSYSTGLNRFEIVSDSLLPDSSKYIYYAPSTDPVYRIDKNYNVFWIPTDTALNWLYYKLDADSGESWIVDVHHIVDTFFVYKLAKVRAIYEGFFSNRTTTFKEITFYQYQSDSVLNEFSWPHFTITLGYDIGEIMEFDEEGGGPYKILKGCIIDGDTIGIITSVEDEFNVINSFELFQNYPNPFNPTTKISYSIKEEGLVTLKVYDVLGKEVATLVNDNKPEGSYEVEFNASQLPSGVYIYTIQAGNFIGSKKMILMK